MVKWISYKWSNGEVDILKWSNGEVDILQVGKWRNLVRKDLEKS